MSTRRRFLRGATLAAVGAPLLAATRPIGGDAGAATATTTPFTHGVASGDPRGDGVVLWTRTDRSLPLTWRVARDPRLADVVAAGTVLAEGPVSVDVGGLAPGTTYWYGFGGDGMDSAVGRTRTLPAAGSTDRVRVAVVACGNLESGWFNAYARVAERDDLDLVLHLGDYIYEYDVSGDGALPLPGRAHHPRVKLRTLDEYRGRYAQYRSDADLQHLHGRHPVVSIWDDHEIANDSWAGGADGHFPEDGSWPDRLAAAMQAWREWHPRSPSQPEAWRRLPLGGLLDAFLIDGRSNRPRMGSADAEPGLASDTLGAEQLAWLRAGLAAPAGRWPVVLTQQPVTPRFDREGRRSARADWSGFPVAQAVVLQLLADAGATVVSGDLHGSWLLDRGSGVEVVVPSVTSRSYADRKGLDAALVEEDDLRRTNAALEWVDVRNHGYVVLDATAERLRVEWWFVDTVEDRTAGQRLAYALDLKPG